MHPTPRHRQLGGRAGFSLLEVLIALAIMALGATLVLVRSSGAVAQVTDHAVFFDFQREVSDLRRDAWRTQAPVVVYAPRAGEPSDTPPGQDAASDALPTDAAAVTLDLKPGWTYRLSQPLRIEASGRCRNVEVDLMEKGRARVHLVSQDNACHFIRTVATAG